MVKEDQAMYFAVLILILVGLELLLHQYTSGRWKK